MNKEYEEEELNCSSHYIDIYEYSDIFINNIKLEILSVKNEVQNKLKDIYNIYNKTLIMKAIKFLRLV